jgi:predicted  nucleic acid-binding Zn-ribbon protein
MIQDLQYLVKLQEIDLRIREQEIAKEQFPAAVADLLKRIAAAEQAQIAATARLDQFTGGIKEVDDQTGKLRDNLAKSQERLNAIQTNREYDAVHAEIEAQKGMLTASENKKKTLETDIDNYTIALERAKKALEDVKSELQPQIDDLNAKIGAIDSNIEEIMKERAQIDPLLTQHTRRTYDSIRKKRKNAKVVSVVTATKTCVNCFMVLRPQLFAEIRRGNDFILCENCGSMMVWDGE